MLQKYKPNFFELDRLVKEKYLKKSISPDGKLVLYNYSDKCIYDKKWNKHTLNSRGSVYEIKTNKIIATAFPKFFNFGELAVSKKKNLMKKEQFEITEKIDGSLGIIYFYNNEWRVNTRGSFNSEQSIWAKNFLDQNIKIDNEWIGYTFLVEIVYPENRILVNYKEREDLFLLAIFDKNGDEIEIPDNFEFKDGSKFAKIRKFQYNSIDDLIKKIEEMDYTEEGFVVKFDNGERVKFKSKEYLKVYRIMSNLTKLSLWKNMKNGKISNDILVTVPEEFRDIIEKYKNELENEYKNMRKEIFLEYEQVMEMFKGVEEMQMRSMIAKSEYINYKTAIFLILNKKQDKISDFIIKHIRPIDNN